MKLESGTAPGGTKLLQLVTSDSLCINQLQFQELLKQREKLLMERLHRGFRKAESQLIAALEDRKGEVKVSACLLFFSPLFGVGWGWGLIICEEGAERTIKVIAGLKTLESVKQGEKRR